MLYEKLLSTANTPERRAEMAEQYDEPLPWWGDERVASAMIEREQREFAALAGQNGRGG